MKARQDHRETLRVFFQSILANFPKGKYTHLGE